MQVTLFRFSLSDPINNDLSIFFNYTGYFEQLFQKFEAGFIFRAYQFRNSQGLQYFSLTFIVVSGQHFKRGINAKRIPDRGLYCQWTGKRDHQCRGIAKVCLR